MAMASSGDGRAGSPAGIRACPPFDRPSQGSRCSMSVFDPDLRRTWLFGPGADKSAHATMLASGADALILDLEDFTPPDRRDEARNALPRYVQACRTTGRLTAVRINALE